MKKVDIEARLHKIEETLVRNTVGLEEHIRRTTILENEIIPLKKQANIMDGLFKIVTGTMAVLVGLKHLGVF